MRCRAGLAAALGAELAQAMRGEIVVDARLAAPLLEPIAEGLDGSADGPFLIWLTSFGASVRKRAVA